MTALAPAPTLDMTPEEFDPAAEAFVASLAPFEAAMIAASAAVAADTVTASAARAAAVAAAHFVGAWSALAGALAVPASVSHDGRVWVLVADVANVAAHEPGVSNQWVLSYPQRRLAVLDAATALLTPAGGNEVLHNEVHDLPLTATTIVSNGTSFVAVAASGSQVAQSLDGKTWTLRALPALGIWSVVPVAGGYMGVRAGSSGATAAAYSTDDGVTWTGFDHAGVTWYAPDPQGFTAGGGGKAIATNNSGVAHVCTVAGTWSAAQNLPASVTRLFVTGTATFVARTATATYHTSTTGLTGSWTARTLPGTCDTVVQDADGALLAWLAGSTTTPIYRSTDGITWASLGLRLVHATASARCINGIPICSPASGATTGWTGHGSKWVPRTLLYAPGTGQRQLAKAGTVHVGIAGALAYRFDHAAADAALSIWE